MAVDLPHVVAARRDPIGHAGGVIHLEFEANQPGMGLRGLPAGHDRPTRLSRYGPSAVTIHPVPTE